MVHMKHGGGPMINKCVGLLFLLRLIGNCVLLSVRLQVSKGQIPEGSVAQLLEPFCLQVCGAEALAVSVAARRLLTRLLRQSELGLSYEDATRAWQEVPYEGNRAGQTESIEGQ